MHHRFTNIALAIGVLFIAGCGGSQKSEDSAEASQDQSSQPEPYVVELRAVGKTFEGPSEIPSGWTTFRFVNASSMLHFAIIDVPPAGVTAEEISETVMAPFQRAMDAMNAGDEEAMNAAFAEFPEWISELGRAGGPGFLSPGLSGQTTVYLEPGYYVVECYIKTDGVFHSTSPGEGQLGMLMSLRVTTDQNNAPEPQADAVLEIRNSGFEIIGGELTPGTNTIRVNYAEQQALPSFVGNDVHIMRVDADDTIANVNAWMDWRTKDGLETPSPATFLGGINDLPAGTHGYVTVDLEPGDYAFIAEIPRPQDAGFVLPFTVSSME